MPPTLRSPFQPSATCRSSEPSAGSPGPSRRVRLLLAAVAAALGALACVPEDGFMSRRWTEARQVDYLRRATEAPLSPGSVSDLMEHLERAARDPAYGVPAGAVPDDAWDGIFDKMWRLRDTSDFDALRFVNLLHAFRGHPAVSEELWQRTEEALLSFKYWYTDDTPVRIVDGEQVVDDMWYWTENHILIFRTCELLAGQLFPDRVFEVTGMTGREHAERARPAILQWLDERARFGFTEWHSNVYAALTMRPLLALVEWAEDPVVAKRAAMVLDIAILDNALHLHRGTYGATHGRSYIKDKASASTENTFPVSKFFFDDTDLPYGGSSSTGAVLARAKKYRLPKVIRNIARHDLPMVDRERMNLPLDEVPPAIPGAQPPPEAPFGWDYRDEEYLPFWWSMGSQTVWMMLPLTLEVAERENLWRAQFDDFADLRDIVWVPGNFERSVSNAQLLAGSLWPIINQSLLKEVNTYTWRSRHAMLSTAQDYRKGVRGSQTHTWQATLDENAMVFTTHPSYLPVEPGDPIPPDWDWQQQDEPGPGFLSGESSQPRAAQHENVVVAIYAPQYPPTPSLGFGYRDETHAYFPQNHFDEVVQEGPWTFGRRGDGYVALYSWRPTLWRGGQPDVFRNQGVPYELVAPGGARNVWIAEVGSREQWPGGFTAFRDAVAGSQVVVTPTADEFEAFEVTYDSPTQGTLELGWEGPLVVEGTPVELGGYPRMDNPFTRVEFDERVYEVSDGDYGLRLDFDRDVREASAPEPPRGGLGRLLRRLWMLLLFG